MSETLCFVYLIVNRHNGHSYIGVPNTPQIRYRQHIRGAGRRQNHYLSNAIRKYGEDAFSLFTLKECSSKQIALQEECRCIKEYHPEYNMTDGGEGAINLPLESRQRISAARKGWVPTDEIRKHMSDAQRGKKFSEEHKRNLSDAGKRRFALRVV